MDALNKLEKLTVIVTYWLPKYRKKLNIIIIIKIIIHQSNFPMYRLYDTATHGTLMNYLPGRCSLCAKADREKHETQCEYKKHETQ